jgi:ethanolamine utilization cobalamin adenosyltransferase
LKYLGHDHLLSEMNQGARVARLNLLRAQIREAELYAADVYIARDFTVTRPDIMRGLNRLSSAVYVLTLLAYLAEQGKSALPERKPPSSP